MNKSDWAGSVQLPSYMQMYIYVPDKLATKPPIMISSHSCGSTATGQLGNIPLSKAAADKNGFILILPDNPGQNCWDVGTTASLTHDGGGDTQAVAQMVKYTIMKYSADPARVYAMGGSGGGMMTQALMAVYPDVFRAGMARAGVPAGCWADGYDSGQQWSNNCAGGNTTKTAQAWGDLVRKMYPGYTGHRPRLQTMQGTSDTTISYKNTAEAIKEWTNVLMLPTDPTSSDKGFKAQIATYDRQFWANSCGYNVLEVWSSPGGTHSMAYEETDMLKFFGLDPLTPTDPEPDCNGMGGSGGMGGTGAGGMSQGGSPGAMGGTGPVGGRGGSAGMSAGGSSGMFGAGGQPATGGTSSSAGGAAPSAGGSAGMQASAGSPGTGGSTGGAGGTGGTGGSPAAGGTGGSTGGTGTTGAAGKPAGGGMPGSAGVGGPAAGTGGEGETQPGGCGCVVGEAKSRHAYSGAVALGLAMLGLRRRRRRSAG